MSKFTDFFKKAGGAILNFFKKLGAAHIMCISILFVTAVLGISLGVWAVTDTSDAEIEIRDAQVLFGELARTEYIAGERVVGDGISLDAGGGKVFDDVEINCDTSSAGVKRVEVSARDGNVYWRGYYAVTVFAVRHYDLKTVPDVTVDADGNLTASGLEIWVDLNAKPTEIPTVGVYDTVVALPSSLYEVTVERDETLAGAYSLGIEFGDVKLEYLMVDAGGETVTIDSRDRVLELNNVSGGDEKLTLYVTKIEDNGNDGENGAEGVYLFTDADGQTSTYRFAFYLNGYSSYFVSSRFGEGLSDRYADDGSEGYFAEVGGATFKADKLPWHKAILNWDN